MKKSIALITFAASIAAVPFAALAQATGEPNQGASGATTNKPGQSLVEGAKANASATGSAMKDTGKAVATGVKKGASAVATGTEKAAKAVKAKAQDVKAKGVKVEAPSNEQRKVD